MSAPLFLPSDDQHRLIDFITPKIATAATVYISSAFFSDAETIEGIYEGKKLVVTVRLEFPTSAAAIRRLQSLPRLKIRGYLRGRAAAFHEKVIYLEDGAGRGIGAYVGSANWTGGGLLRNQEAGVWLTDAESLRKIKEHLVRGHAEADQITEQTLSALEREAAWFASRAVPPRKERGTLSSSWKSLPPSERGRFLVKQNGTGNSPFICGEHEFRGWPKNHSAQMFGEVPSTFSTGQGILLTWIARREDGTPDRLIYGRGRIAAFDSKRWRLPEKYLANLRTRGESEQDIEHLQRWPEIVWLDPIEIIDYPDGCRNFLWLSDLAGVSEFRRGFTYIDEPGWKRCNVALDRATDLSPRN